MCRYYEEANKMKMPPSEIYESELEFMPYKKSLKRIEDIVCKETPRHKSVLDLMCGPGVLLGRIKTRRKDLLLRGVDNNIEYVRHASQRYPCIVFDYADALEWKPDKLYDLVLCTGALHHISYERQEEMIRKISRIITPNGLAIISDCYIDDYQDETERALAAAKLGYEYLTQTIKNGAPKDVVKETAEVLTRDVLLDGEYKISLFQRQQIFRKYFSIVNTETIWRPCVEGECGDYITLLVPRI
jgi:2-polyprenyl-3-methyl-5-hydroxy-6-metoxy-1,4-benzoquinol methylase